MIIVAWAADTDEDGLQQLLLQESASLAEPGVQFRFARLDQPASVTEVMQQANVALVFANSAQGPLAAGQELALSAPDFGCRAIILCHEDSKQTSEIVADSVNESLPPGDRIKLICHEPAETGRMVYQALLREKMAFRQRNRPSAREAVIRNAEENLPWG